MQKQLVGLRLLLLRHYLSLLPGFLWQPCSRRKENKTMKPNRNIPSTIRKNLLDKKFEKWTVIGYGGKGKLHSTLWQCRCSCGKEKNVGASDLLRGSSTKCSSCARKGIRSNLLDQTFGEWTVIGLGKKTKIGLIFWRCRCSCGKISEITSGNLTSGGSTRCHSCGCLSPKKLKHGLLRKGRSGRPAKAISRLNSYHATMKARGKLCEEWLDFGAFYASVGKKIKGYHLRRKNINEKFSPDNFFWTKLPFTERVVQHLEEIEDRFGITAKGLASLSRNAVKNKIARIEGRCQKCNKDMTPTERLFCLICDYSFEHPKVKEFVKQNKLKSIYQNFRKNRLLYAGYCKKCKEYYKTFHKAYNRKEK